MKLLEIKFQDHDVVVLSKGDVSFQNLWPYTKNSLLEWDQQWCQGSWLRCRKPTPDRSAFNVRFSFKVISRYMVSEQVQKQQQC